MQAALVSRNTQRILQILDDGMAESAAWCGLNTRQELIIEFALFVLFAHYLALLFCDP